MKNFGRHCGYKLHNLAYTALVMFVCLFNGIGHADETTTTVEQELVAIPLAATHASWVFSGAVTAETGETYDYFFQVKRHANHIQALVSLIDAQNKAVIFMEDRSSDLTADSSPDNWSIGPVFIRYNTINSSWVMGLDKGNQVGFNFKVDMLNQSTHDAVAQHFRKDVQVVVAQTGQVNGSVQLKEDVPAQFVTGKNAWFRQVVLTDAYPQSSELQGLLCRFDDGSRLYAMKLIESDVVRGTFSGLYNPEGMALAVSQFIRVDHADTGAWQVKVPYPKLQFEFADALQHQSVALGFMTNKDKQGFCVMSKDA